VATGSLIASYTVIDGYASKLLGIHPGVLELVFQPDPIFQLARSCWANRARHHGTAEGALVLAAGVGALSPCRTFWC